MWTTSNRAPSGKAAAPINPNVAAQAQPRRHDRRALAPPAGRWPSRPAPAGHNKNMYLLLAAHPRGVALQEILPAGQANPANPEPRVLAPGDLPAVVRELEARRPGGQPPRWIWHRTQDWYPALLASGVEVERCYDITLCGNILAFSQFGAHTDYARNTDRVPVEDPMLPPKALLPPRPPAEVERCAAANRWRGSPRCPRVGPRAASTRMAARAPAGPPAPARPALPARPPTGRGGPQVPAPGPGRHPDRRTALPGPPG